jgi:hypothetical protein
MWLDLPTVWAELQHVDPLLGNNRKTNNETSAAGQQILNKQIYEAITE